MRSHLMGLTHLTVVKTDDESSEDYLGGCLLIYKNLGGGVIFSYFLLILRKPNIGRFSNLSICFLQLLSAYG